MIMDSSAIDSPLRIVSFNCIGVKSSAVEIAKLCECVDIILLQETWLLPHDLQFLNSVNSNFHGFGISSVDTGTNLVGRPYGGMAILWRKCFGNSVGIQNFDDDRILGITVRSSDAEMLILNVYLPVPDTAENLDLYQEYIGKIQALVLDSGHNHVIVPGDWNARSDRVEWQWLRDFCDETDMIMSDVSRLPVDSFTCVSSHDTTSWIDHVIMSRGADQACCEMSVQYDFVTSNHRPLVFSIRGGELARVVGHTGEASMKVHWDRLSEESIDTYSATAGQLLGAIVVPVRALLCEGCDHPAHKAELGTYYGSVVEALLTAGASFAPASLQSGQRTIQPSGSSSVFRGLMVSLVTMCAGVFPLSRK